MTAAQSCTSVCHESMRDDFHFQLTVHFCKDLGEDFRLGNGEEDLESLSESKMRRGYYLDSIRLLSLCPIPQSCLLTI